MLATNYLCAIQMIRANGLPFSVKMPWQRLQMPFLHVVQLHKRLRSVFQRSSCKISGEFVFARFKHISLTLPLFTSKLL